MAEPFQAPAERAEACVLEGEALTSHGPRGALLGWTAVLRETVAGPRFCEPCGAAR